MHLKTIPILTALGLSVGALFARELKEFDNDVNYDEARVPHYDLPDPLITAEGKPVTSAEQWRNIRPLLTGRHLVRLGVPKGPQVGWLMDTLLEARLEGQVVTRADEEALVRHILSETSPE